MTKTKISLRFKPGTPKTQRIAVRSLAQQLADQQVPVSSLPPSPANPRKPQRLYVRDDQGERWYFDGDRIRCVGDASVDGGYACDSLEDGIRLLNQYGYITGERKGKQ